MTMPHSLRSLGVSKDEHASDMSRIMPSQRAHRRIEKQSIGRHAYPVGLSRIRTVTRQHYRIFITSNTENRYSSKRVFDERVARQACRAKRPYDIEITQYCYTPNYSMHRAEYDMRQNGCASILPKGVVSDSEGA